MLEPRGDEGGDGRDDRQHLVRGGAAAVAEPDREAHQAVAEHAEHDGLPKTEPTLRIRRRQRRGPDGAAPELILPAEKYEPRSRDRSHEIAEVDDPPLAQHRPSADLAAGPSHDDQVVAGEQ